MIHIVPQRLKADRRTPHLLYLTCRLDYQQLCGANPHGAGRGDVGDSKYPPPPLPTHTHTHAELPLSPVPARGGVISSLGHKIELRSSRDDGRLV